MNMANFNSAEYKKRLASSVSCQTCEKVPVPQIEEDQNYIFISYAHRDYKTVYADIADMYEAGVRFWYDKGLSAGKKWDEEVLEKLRNPHCVGVIFYMSENLFLSQSAVREIEIACSLAKADGDTDRIPINHFSVNLTDDLPVQILFNAMHCQDGRSLNMQQIGLLSQMFPDNATYICYHAPDHKTELIAQIKKQFGVINTLEEDISLRIDRKSSSVFIGTLTEKLNVPDRLRLIKDIQTVLNEAGITSYVMQDNSGSVFHDELSRSLKEYVDQQNQAKMDAAEHILLITTMLGLGLCSRLMGEFDPTVSLEKTVYYLIDSEDASVEDCKRFFGLDENSSILQRVFFLSDYKERLPAAILARS